MNNYTISNLVLIILDSKNNYYARMYAEKELKRRLKLIDSDYYKFMDEEEKRINKRGFNINNYLFSKNPTLQQLMELYFSYVYNNDANQNMLLFSERHLCNNKNFASLFFDEICDIQIDRIDDLIDFVVESNEKENLRLAKELLLKRKRNIDEKYKKTTRKIDKLKYNEALLYLRDYKFIPLKSIDKQEIQKLYGLGLTLKDSSRLKQQKQLLLNSVKLVDYNTKIMNEAFTKILKK